MAEENKRFEVLYNESKKFSNAVGLPEDVIIEIYRAESDWELILKIYCGRKNYARFRQFFSILISWNAFLWAAGYWPLSMPSGPF
jgi:Lhr-like helicase